MKNRKWIAICFAVSLALGMSGCEWEVLDGLGKSPDDYPLGEECPGANQWDRCYLNQICRCVPPKDNLKNNEVTTYKLEDLKGLALGDDFSTPNNCASSHISACIDNCEDKDQVMCGITCIDPKTNSKYCGAALGGYCNSDNKDDKNYKGIACLSGFSCEDGICVESCQDGQIVCGGNCVNPKNDRFWCGAKDNCIGENSGKKCNDGEVCADGVCDTSCPGGQTICTTEDGATCVDINSDPKNCGECGNVCPKGNACIDGACSASCLEGQELCGNACVVLSSDPNNCGECGNKCPPGNACVNGSCSADCLEGQELCGNACVVLASDPNNCGECGNICPEGNACKDGECVASCLGSQVFCGGKCIDPQSDTTYCGATLKGTCDADDAASANYKGKTCAAGEICSDGKCVLSCQDGLIECNGVCANPQNDKDNCGKCGIKCSENAQICVDGQCACPAGYTLCAGEGCVDLAATHRSECKKCIDSSWGDCDSNWKTGCETNLMTSNSNCEACGHECTSGTFCSNGVCSATCGGDLTKCNVNKVDGCYNLTNDAKHCGECNKPCPNKTNAVASCSGSSCIYTCKAGYTNCGTPSEPNCLNLNTDGDNCGACNNKCTNLPNVSSGSCSGGVCQISCQSGFADCNSSSTDGCEAKLSETNRTACSTCASNYANCDGNWNNGCEINIKSDNANCGACSKNNDHKCDTGKVCSNGTCSASCLANQQLCGSSCLTLADMHLSNCNTCATNYCDSDNNKINGCEVKKGTSVDHCTACNTACTTKTNATAFCNNGTCTYICNSGYTNCGTDTAPNCIKVTGDGATDANNCGYCGFKCSDNLSHAKSSTISCDKGVCKFTQCDNNYASCDGSDANGCEVNSKTDQTHCGANNKCSTDATDGENCTGGRVCNNGSCVCAIEGHVFCNGKCIDPKTDATYCGASGNCSGSNDGETCTGGKVCNNGVCTCPSGLTYCKTGNTSTCVDPQTNKQYCGCTTSSGGVACSNDQYCGGGKCETASCSANQCYVNGCVANTNNKGCGANCNDCTSAGGSGLHSTNGTCSSGQCVASACETGYCAKDGTCRSNTEPTSCGASCTDCTTTGRICSNGNCICPDNKVYCKTSNNTSACIDPTKDNEFCGCTNSSVGTNCDAIPHVAVGACKNNSCTLACESGYSVYDAACYKQYKLFNFTSDSTGISDHGEGISSSIENEQLKIVGMPKSSFVETKYIEFDIGTIAATTIAYVRFNAKAKNNYVKFKLEFYSGDTKKGGTVSDVSVSTTPGMITPIEITNTAFSNLKIRMYVNKTNNGDNHLIIDDFEVYGY